MFGSEFINIALSDGVEDRRNLTEIDLDATNLHNSFLIVLLPPLAFSQGPQHQTTYPNLVGSLAIGKAGNSAVSGVEEHWTRPAGGSMLGMSRTVAGNRTAEFEFLRIEQREDGIYYVAQPSVAVPLRISANKSQRVKLPLKKPATRFSEANYLSEDEDSLTASIDAGEGSKAMTFQFRRMAMTIFDF